MPVTPMAVSARMRSGSSTVQTFTSRPAARAAATPSSPVPPSQGWMAWWPPATVAATVSGVAAWTSQAVAR